MKISVSALKIDPAIKKYEEYNEICKNIAMHIL
jgi:hypothetical protein